MPFSDKLVLETARPIRVEQRFYDMNIQTESPMNQARRHRPFCRRAQRATISLGPDVARHILPKRSTPSAVVLQPQLVGGWLLIQLMMTRY
nr:hypothetical protein CFP56_13076 [Quercus suber]